MKKFYFFLLCLLSFPLKAAIALGTLVRMKTSSPVFEKASAKAKILADVDADTVLTVLEESPRGSWLKVTDEDGNVGWIPRERTDFPLTPPAPPPAEKKVEEPAPERKRRPSLLDHHFSFVIRQAFSDPNGSMGLGFMYGLYSRRYTFHFFTNEKRVRRLGLTTGYVYMTPKANYQGFNIPIRVQMLSTEEGDYFGEGPDLGALYMRKTEGGVGTSSWSASAGYSWGLLAHGTGPLGLLRFGIEFFTQTRFSIELRIGWSL